MSHILALAPSPLSAGQGRLVEEVDLNLLSTNGQPDAYGLYEVSGTSCHPLIPHGSTVLVHRQREPKNGDIVAAVVNGLAHIKIFERRKAHLWLVPPNPDFEPIEVKPYDDFQCLGVVEKALTDILPIPPTGSTLFHFTDMKKVGDRIRATVTDDRGHSIEMDYTPDEVLKGCKMAFRELKRKVLPFMGL